MALTLQPFVSVNIKLNDVCTEIKDLSLYFFFSFQENNPTILIFYLLPNIFLQIFSLLKEIHLSHISTISI